jgi:hypothetical protein
VSQAHIYRMRRRCRLQSVYASAPTGPRPIRSLAIGVHAYAAEVVREAWLEVGSDLPRQWRAGVRSRPDGRPHVPSAPRDAGPIGIEARVDAIGSASPSCITCCAASSAARSEGSSAAVTVGLTGSRGAMTGTSAKEN